MQLINGALITEAKLLLRQPDATVKQVPDDCGVCFRRLSCEELDPLPR